MCFDLKSLIIGFTIGLLVGVHNPAQARTVIYNTSVRVEQSAVSTMDAYVYDIYFSPTITNDISDYHELVTLLQKLGYLDDVVVHMSNFGGSVWTGAYLFNAISTTNARTRTIVESPSFSMGAMLSCATDSVTIQPMSFLMYHTYSAIMQGNGVSIRESAKAWEKLGRTMMNRCVDVGVLTKDQINQILDGKDTYIFAEDL